MDSPAERLIAADVVRGVSRMLYRHDYFGVAEVPLGNARRADIMALGPKGEVIIVEVKISRADLLGDGKWPDYLDYCDRYFWAVPQGFDLDLFERESLAPKTTGLIVADRYDAAILREPDPRPLAAARRKAETLRLARMAARRMMVLSSVLEIEIEG
ncbi:MAG: DNA repair protein MmcB-related protein [Sphingomonadaceae bacterium]|nr:DNA repair protein MmcB-related protein [Sphingomonadaceae bacterium]